MCDKCEETIFNVDGSLKGAGEKTLADALVGMGPEVAVLVIDDGIKLLTSLAMVTLAGFMTAPEKAAARILSKSLQDAARRLSI